MISASYENTYNKIKDEFPLLTREEEYNLVDTIRKYKGGKQKQEAREILFNSNLRLVLKEANFYVNKSNHIPFEDLVSAGNEGLWIATDKFNPKKFKTKFSTYATPWIKLGIYRLLNTFSHIVSIPSHIKYKGHKYRKIKGDDKLNLTDSELMKELDVSKKVLGYVKLSQSKGLSLDKEYKVGSDEESKKPLIGFVADEKSDSPSSILLKSERKQIIHNALNMLSPVEKDILISRYLKGEKDNLKKVGKKHGVSGERVRQIERDALLRLQRKLKNKMSLEA